MTLSLSTTTDEALSILDKPNAIALVDFPFTAFYQKSDMQFFCGVHRQHAVALSPLTKYMLSKKGSTYRTMYHVFNAIARMLGYDTPYKIDFTTLALVDMSYLHTKCNEKGLAANTICLYFSAIKSVVKQAFKDDLITVKQREEILEYKMPKPDNYRQFKPIHDDALSLVIDDFNRAMKNPKAHLKVIRDTAIIFLYQGSGIRRTEGANVMLKDLDIDNGYVHVLGKGNKRRDAAIHSDSINFILPWLSLRGDKPGPLFYAINKGNKILYDKPLKHTGIYNVAKRYDIAPHDFRRTLATTLYNQGVDLLDIQGMLNHKDMKTMIDHYIINDKKASIKKAMDTTSLIKRSEHHGNS